jgi:formylglycine-generating enzyme required for sulfatase activity
VYDDSLFPPRDLYICVLLSLHPTHDGEKTMRHPIRFSIGLAVLAVILLAGIGIMFSGEGRTIAQENETPTWIPADSPNGDWMPVTSEINGIPVVYVPAGCFTMGSGEYGNLFHEVCLDAFWIGQTEVTWTQYQACVDAGACRDYAPYKFDIAAKGDYPIEGVTWLGARLFARWLGGDLPTEAQWEYAARGPESWIYPWGDGWDGSRVNYCSQECVARIADNTNEEPAYQVLPVGSFPEGASWVGALDMSGNLAELVADRYGTYQIGRQVNPTGPQIGERVVARGGNYYDRKASDLRADARASRELDAGSSWYGFRVMFPVEGPLARPEPPITDPEPVMLDVPAGCFMMGSEAFRHNASPVHEVCLNAYQISETEITNAQYRACVEAGVCETPRSREYGDPAYDHHPVTGITWHDAFAYAKWVGGSLPTEAQWEYAARGPQGFIYPWGNEFDPARLNFRDMNVDSSTSDMNHDDGYWHTAPVGSYSDGASWVGALDMAGNVMEWVNDWWARYPDSYQVDPTGPLTGKYYVARGGSWSDTADFTQTTVRVQTTSCQGKACPTVGFRIVKPTDSATAALFATPESVVVVLSTFAAGNANAAWTPVVEQKNGLPVVSVPEGCFMMGSSSGEGDEVPVHEVCLDAYWIGQTEVTNAQYRACVDDGVCPPPLDRAWFDDPAYDAYPVVEVTWDGATAYAAWIGGSLPTEAQWEYAARGPEAWTYPWGNAFDGERTNFCDTNCDRDWRSAEVNDGYGQIAPVGSYPGGASWVGALDIAGNVWEWTADWYGSYPAESQTNPTGPESGESRVVRGGSWAESSYLLRTTYRDYDSPGSGSALVGFRVVLPPDPVPQATPRPVFVPPTIAAPIPTATPDLLASVFLPGTSNAGWSPEVREVKGIPMVHVPGGCFMIGSTPNQIEAAFQTCEYVMGRGQCKRTWFEDQGPAHEVCLSEYWIGQTEITNAQYKTCVDAGVCYLPGYPSSVYQNATWGDPVIADNPVTVTWEQAAIYTQWVGASLPTEAQWEYAARGPEGLIYPWGNQWDGLRLNYCDKTCNWGDRDFNFDDGYPKLAPVGSYPDGASWVGALDLLGNVSEWTADRYGDYGAGRQIDPTGPATGEWYVVRGGDWRSNWVYLLATDRDAVSPTGVVGFRIVMVR